MPELPEVETIRRQLENHIHNAIVSAVIVYRQDIIRGEIGQLRKQRIISIRRFGKLLVLDFSKRHSMCVHLKMTGRLTLLREGEPLPSHTHVELAIQSNSDLQRMVFSDARRFGYIHILETADVEKLPFIQSLGKEPLKSLSLTAFKKLLSKSSRPIKTLLLDQTRIAGLGNIYVCEALWMAIIHPERKANQISDLEVKALFTAIEKVLQEGIDRGGASDHTYRDALGEKGDYQNFFKVYGRAGAECVRCHQLLMRFVLGGRGTWYCPTCQK